MSLRYPVTIRRRAEGAWVDGRWVNGAESAPETILATVQPAQSGDYDQLEPLLEGRRVDGMVRVYTSEQIQIAGQGLTNGDLLVWPEGMRDRPYVFVARSPWQSRIIPHYRYLAALVPGIRYSEEELLRMQIAEMYLPGGTGEQLHEHLNVTMPITWEF